MKGRNAIIAIVILALIYFAITVFSDREEPADPLEYMGKNTQGKEMDSSMQQREVDKNDNGQDLSEKDKPASLLNEKNEKMDLNDDDDDPYEVVTPADQKYASAKEALDAIKKAALDYNDMVIEEFSGLKDCQWCDEVYRELRKMVNNKNLDIDERSFYGELLAATGNVENLQTLVDGFQNAKDDEERDLYAGSLEMTDGDDEAVEFLKNYVDSDDELLRESVVSGLTNFGSRLAVEVLYNDLVRRKDKEGYYYSVGIGLGEVIPDDDALPFLQQIVISQDEYAGDKAVDAMFNNGLQGAIMAFDALASVKDPDKLKYLLRTALDHVLWEPGMEDFLKKAMNNPSYPEILRDFAKKAYEDIKDDDEYYDDNMEDQGYDDDLGADLDLETDDIGTENTEG